MWVDSVSPRTHGLLNENCNTRHEIPPYKLLVREVPEVSKTAQSVGTNLGLPPQLHSKTLLLKILHILTAGYIKINSKPTGNLPPYWPALLVLERDKGPSREEKASMVFSSLGPSVVQHWCTRQSTGTIESQLLSDWTGGLIHRREFQIRYCDPGKKFSMGDRTCYCYFAKWLCCQTAWYLFTLIYIDLGCSHLWSDNLLVVDNSQ